MKLNEFKNNNRAYLYEGLTPKHKKSMQLWESVGTKLVEAQLTQDQITQLFQQVEQGATASGTNRTAIGKGKDAADAVAQAYKDLKAKAINSQPMQKADALYDQAAEKLKQATGGDAGVMQYVQKYRDFAKAHPIAQSLIYGTLIAAAGITGAGAGGAAALGLFKMVDKLLQGEKFSAAAVAGAETGLAAFAASKLGDLIKGVKPGEQVPAPTDGKPISTAGYDFANKDYYLSPSGTQTIAVPKGYGNPWEEGTKAYNIRQQLKSQMGVQESKIYTVAQVTALFESVVAEAELWNQFKSGVGQAAGAVGNKLQQVGKNITTKVTADKLQKAWVAAGSPTDSVEVGKILTGAGVDLETVKTAMQTIGVEPSVSDIPPDPGADEAEKPSDTATREFNPRSQQWGWRDGNSWVSDEQDIAQPADATQPDYSRVPDVSTLTPQQKQELLAQLDALDAQQPAAKQHTGGRQKGGLSQTPNAIRQRQSRAAKTQPAQTTTAQPSLTDLIRQRQAQGMTESYADFRKKLKEAIDK